MSSGQAKTKSWVLEFVNDTGRDVDPLMGWTSSSDTQSQVKLRFDSKEAALDYAEGKGITAVVTEPSPKSASRSSARAATATTSPPTVAAFGPIRPRI